MVHQSGCILLKNLNCKLFSKFFLILFVPTVAIAASTTRLNASNTDTAIKNNPPQSQKSSVPPQSQKPAVNSSQTIKLKKSESRNRVPPSDYSRAGGSRGCAGETIPLTVLAPTTFVGETISVRPTFTWFVSQPQPTEFRLFKLDENTSTPKRIGIPIKLQSRSGINQLSFPQNQPALTVGASYIWQVSIDCLDSPFIQRAEFRVVQKPAVLDGKLSSVVDNSQKAYIYAEQDLWYEALAEALKVAPQGQLGKVGSDIVQNLAQSDSFVPEQLIPDQLEVAKKEIQQRRNYLEKIAGGD